MELLGIELKKNDRGMIFCGDHLKYYNKKYKKNKLVAHFYKLDSTKEFIGEFKRFYKLLYGEPIKDRDVCFGNTINGTNMHPIVFAKYFQWLFGSIKIEFIADLKNHISYPKEYEPMVNHIVSDAAINGCFDPISFYRELYMCIKFKENSRGASVDEVIDLNISLMDTGIPPHERITVMNKYLNK